jgi:hypothetical protein
MVAVAVWPWFGSILVGLLKIASLECRIYNREISRDRS